MKTVLRGFLAGFGFALGASVAGTLIGYGLGKLGEASVKRLFSPEPTSDPGSSSSPVSSEPTAKERQYIAENEERRASDRRHIDVSPSGYITGVDYGPCFGGCTPNTPCSSRQSNAQRHWFSNPANAKYVEFARSGRQPDHNGPAENVAHNGNYGVPAFDGDNDCEETCPTSAHTHNRHYGVTDRTEFGWVCTCNDDECQGECAGSSRVHHRSHYDVPSPEAAAAERKRRETEGPVPWEPQHKSDYGAPLDCVERPEHTVNDWLNAKLKNGSFTAETISNED